MCAYNVHRRGDVHDSGRTFNPRGPQLIAYADRLGGDLPSLSEVLVREFGDVFDGVHVLPFFRPYDGADAGFDPEDHAVVDPRLGDWSDVERLARSRRVMSDLIVNHMSVRSDEFRQFAAEGGTSSKARLFLTMSSIFPQGATEGELARIYRPRPGLPFTPMTIGGQERLVWTTFTADQVDLDVRSQEFWEYLTHVIDTLVAAGVTMLRLDAVGYTGKVAGTDCFMTDESTALVRRISEYAHNLGAEVLLEVHGHHQLQVEIAAEVDYVYDFALPPLVLHALHTGNPAALHRWLQIRPTNAINVLDTHDGIGIVDVGPSTSEPAMPGLLNEEQLDQLVEAIHTASGDTSRLATGAAASNLDLYQVNCTYFDALGRDEDALMVARLVQLLMPGIPQIYYVGLLAGANDVTLLRATGVGRDINRAYYDSASLTTAVGRPIVRRQLDAIRWRSAEPAFSGTFDSTLDGTTLHLTWVSTESQVAASIDFATRDYRVTANGHSIEFDARDAFDPRIER